MITKNTILNVIDNSGVSKLLCIGNLSKKTLCISVGDIVIGVVKKIKKNSSINISSIVRAIVVTSREFFNIKDGSHIKFSSNSAIILTKKNTPMGNRVLKPFYYKSLHYKLSKIQFINI